MLIQPFKKAERQLMLMRAFYFTKQINVTCWTMDEHCSMVDLKERWVCFTFRQDKACSTMFPDLWKSKCFYQ